MATFRMLYIDGTVEGPAAVAEMIRLALSGMEPQEEAALPAPTPGPSPDPEPEPLPVAAKTEVREPRKYTPHQGKPARVKHEAPARKTAEDSLPNRILAMIRKGPPRSTSEIADQLRKQGFTGTNGAVYQACKFWRDKGIVISKPDDSIDGGGVMKQYIAGEK